MPKSTDSSPNDQPWYKNGLQFKCTGCGDCCTGDPGFVWVNKAEVAALATEVGLDVKTFESRYVRSIGVRKSLKEYKNGDCVFFDGQTRKCKVYDARPRQCRTWPFWDSNIRSPKSWAETCEACPGSGTGQLYQLEEIQQQAAVVKV